MSTPIPAIARTDAEWEALAAEEIARSGVLGEDPGPLATALKNSAAREAALADTYWLDLTTQAAEQFMSRDIS